MGSELDPWGPLWGGVIGCFVNAHIPTLRTFSLNDPIVSKLPRPILSSIHCPCKPFPKFNNQTWKNEQGFKKTGQWGTTSFHGPLLTLASLLRWEPFWLLACPLDPLKMVECHWSLRNVVLMVQMFTRLVVVRKSESCRINPCIVIQRSKNCKLHDKIAVHQGLQCWLMVLTSQ